MRKGKTYRQRFEMVDRERRYSLEEALQLLKEMPPIKFDETVEMSFRLGIDPRQADQNVRGALALPHGTGKSATVVVIAQGEAADAAREAGADEVGFDDLIERMKGGWLDFDVLIATPDCMGKLRALGRVLGPRGLMPNPKSGTVTDDTGGAVRMAKAGRVEYRADRGGCIHVPVGKRSFATPKLLENCHAVIKALLRAKPATAKGIYMLSCTVSATMSPGVHVDEHEFTRS